MNVTGSSSWGRADIEATDDKPVRLQVYLARSGVASRRSSEALILAGRVAVNGAAVTVLGTKVAPGDTVTLDGAPLRPETAKHYLALNKPVGYICSSSDPQNRPLALDLLPQDIPERLYNVGRLDFRSSGLILFTNDGEFSRRISHPSAQIEKEYLVEASGQIPDAVVEAFLHGVEVEGVFYKARELEKTGRKSLRIVLVEGKNREIRRVFSHFHLHPERLHRVRIGPVTLDGLAEGASRPLTKEELGNLEKTNGHSD